MTAERTTTEIEVLRPCPVCASPFTAYLRHVPTRRTKRWIPLYVCLDCDSLCNPSGYVETPAQLSADLQWHISVTERNRDAAGVLFDRLATAGVRLNTVLEVGCGIGTAPKDKSAASSPGPPLSIVIPAYKRPAPIAVRTSSLVAQALGRFARRVGDHRRRRRIAGQQPS